MTQALRSTGRPTKVQPTRLKQQSDTARGLRLAEIKHRLDRVFGLTRELPLTYVERKSVDHKLVDALASDKHIVLFGSSKQGKTSLRRHCLSDDDYIVVQCLNTWDLSHLHSQILKEAGFVTEQSSTKTLDGKSKVKLSGTFDVKLGVASGKVEVGREREYEHKKIIDLEIDPADANDVIRALDAISFKRIIVLEDFHSLPDDTQNNFSFSLRVFHERSDTKFIIVAVWLEENRLILQNGDLSGRVIDVNADRWTHEELCNVIEAGSALLNIEVDTEFQNGLIKNCFGSVYIVQEALKQLCTEEGVRETQDRLTSVGKGIAAKDVIVRVVSEHKARYTAALLQISFGFKDTALEMYKWLLLPILTADPHQLEKGLQYAKIRSVLDEYHPASPLNPGTLTQALRKIEDLQAQKKIKPLLFDYDRSNLRLNVVDKGFLIWLGVADLEAVRGEIELPIDLNAAKVATPI